MRLNKYMAVLFFAWWYFIKIIFGSLCSSNPKILDLNELINDADLELEVQLINDVALRKFIAEL